jgi:hypothetical protein
VPRDSEPDFLKNYAKKILVHAVQVKNVLSGLELTYPLRPALNSEFLNGNPHNITVLITQQDFSLPFLKWAAVLMIMKQFGIRLMLVLVLPLGVPVYFSAAYFNPNLTMKRFSSTTSLRFDATFA